MIFDLDPDDLDFNNLDDVRKTFLLIFTTVIWRRVWVTASLYADHNCVNITKPIVLKSIKYNIYSPSGIGESFKSGIKKALRDGYVMPNTYNDKYLKTAIHMFKDAYNVVTKNDKHEMGLFVTRYALRIFNNTDNKGNKGDKGGNKGDKGSIKGDKGGNKGGGNKGGGNKGDGNKGDKGGNNSIKGGETSDIITMINKLSGSKNKKTLDFEPVVKLGKTGKKTICGCGLCSLVNNWNINNDLLYSGDTYKNIIFKDMLEALEAY